MIKKTQIVNTQHRITWYRDELQLRATGAWDYSNPGLSAFNESTMDPIQAWSVRNHCGVRISFDTWQFKSNDEITMFLLRWS